MPAPKIFRTRIVKYDGGTDEELDSWEGKVGAEMRGILTGWFKAKGDMYAYLVVHHLPSGRIKRVRIIKDGRAFRVCRLDRRGHHSTLDSGETAIQSNLQEEWNKIVAGRRVG